MNDTTIDQLDKIYPDMQWLEDKGQFTRMSTEGEESVWFCTLCSSVDVDADEGVCYCCGGHGRDGLWLCPQCSVLCGGLDGDTVGGVCYECEKKEEVC